MSDVDPLFTPASVAVFGACDRDESVGGMIYRNLAASGFKGPCYAINPKYDQVAGRSCHKSLGELGRPEPSENLRPDFVTEGPALKKPPPVAMSKM